jgi:hypothetical protein
MKAARVAYGRPVNALTASGGVRDDSVNTEGSGHDQREA